MTAKIIIQVVLGIIAGGAVAGLIKFPGKQKAIAVFHLFFTFIFNRQTLSVKTRQT